MHVVRWARAVKYLPELITFVADPALPADHNAAERSLRPIVVRRKISRGTRSARGIQLRTGLETFAAQGKQLLETYAELLRDPTLAPV
jgi:hypothetical protein